MKKLFEEPKLELLNIQDVITTLGDNELDGLGSNNSSGTLG